MDRKSLDLNLLVVFDALFEHRSVTRAGEAVGLSQPAMSAALQRLRRLFNDPLFVRSGAEMKPTPCATILASPVRSVMDTVQRDILQRSSFDPASTDRIFAVATPDIGEVRFIPALLKALGKEAPHAQLHTLSLPRLTAAEALESGAADLALGYFPDLHRAGFFQQRLFGNRHVCILRRGHPLSQYDTLTLDQYLDAAHAVVRPEGREHTFETFLNSQGLRRKVTVQLSHFTSLPRVIEESDLIATVPHDLALMCSRYADVCMRETPMASPITFVSQFWHERFHRDAAHVWLRGVVHRLFVTAE